MVVVGWGRGLGEDQGSNKGLVRSQGRVPTGRAEGLFDMKVKDRSRQQHPGSNADQWETLTALRLVQSSLSGEWTHTSHLSSELSRDTAEYVCVCALSVSSELAQYQDPQRRNNTHNCIKD